MNRWWCMDCRTVVELNKHGRCARCESEAVDSMERGSTKPASMVHGTAETVSPAASCA
jgi:hypothetical protein